MKLKAKILWIIGFSIAGIALVTSIILKVTIIGNIEKQELSFINDNYERAMSMLKREEDTLEKQVLVWTVWDDTFSFLHGSNSSNIDVKLNDNEIWTLGLNFMIYLDANGEKASSKLFGVGNPQIFESEFLKKLSIADHLPEFRKDYKPITGIMLVSGKAVLMSASPFTSSSGMAPIDGYLVMGQILDNSLLQYLKDVLHVDIHLETIQADNLTALDFKKTVINHHPFWMKKNKDNIIAYAPLDKLKGNEEAYLVFDVSRQTYRSGVSTVLIFGFLFMIAQIIIIIVCVAVIERLVTHPLKRLLNFMGAVGQKKDTSARLDFSGDDELSELAVTTNVMLEELDVSYSHLRVMEERFRLIIEATNDGYFDLNLAENKFYMNPEWMKFLGYDQGEYHEELEHLIETVHPDDKGKLVELVGKLLAGRTEQIRIEFRVPKKTGEWLWVLARGKLVEIDPNGKPVRYIGNVSDINMQKKYEEENLYLSQTDVVTTLKNRAFIETILRDAGGCSSCINWIIMGDVNGLKIINDSFGHLQGDQLLRTIGGILKKCCSSDDTPARWGGDEFIILIQNKSAAYVEDLIHRIKHEFDVITEFPIKVSMALGYAHNHDENEDISNVIKSAEERMYRNKLLESRSARSAIISSLEQSLHEKHIETEEHTKRIKQLCLEIGESMGLTSDEMDELALLGVLHDIGKIAIPEAVLMKPGSLTPEEWEIMKRHSEIGYRIAASTPDLAHIADEILSHHERYDGTGYPQGLKGKEIPKLSRLLTIVDSFDVMTHDRHYKKAMSIESAVQELRDCSGKQFDPEMTDLFISLITKKQ